MEFGVGLNQSGEAVILNGGINKFPSRPMYIQSHAHPIVNEFQMTPSAADLDYMQGRVTNLLHNSPGASIPPHEIIWSPTEPPTRFSPLPKNYLTLKGG